MDKNTLHNNVDDYCVVDTETTGFSSQDSIIEIGILKVRHGEIVDKYEQLINPQKTIHDNITKKTGITNEMLEGMPTLAQVKDDVLSFIGDDTILGHNISFDIRFLESGFGIKIENKRIDTCKFSQKIYPEFSNHTLDNLSVQLNLTRNEHRAIADCFSADDLYKKIKKALQEKESISPISIDIDKNSLFYGRHVAFTGKLERMTQKEAEELVLNCGGILDKTVKRGTNYLILGDNTHNNSVVEGKSANQRKAEKMISEGRDIVILDEFVFYDIVK